MKKQMKKPSREITRVYGRAEATIEVDPNMPGTVLERTIRLRFQTWDLDSGRSDVQSPTPWVMFSLDAAEHLSVQLAGLVETARHWEPSAKAEVVGPGIVVRGPFEDS